MIFRSMMTAVTILCTTIGARQWEALQVLSAEPLAPDLLLGVRVAVAMTAIATMPTHNSRSSTSTARTLTMQRQGAPLPQSQPSELRQDRRS